MLEQIENLLKKGIGGMSKILGKASFYFKKGL